ELSSGVPAISGSIGVGAALLLGGMLVTTSGQLPGWADPLNLLLTSTIYLGPLAAGATALQLGQLRSSGLLGLPGTTPRSGAGAIRLGWLAIAVWQLVALVVLGVLILVRSDLSGGLSAPMLLLPVQAALVVGSASAVGAVCGVAWPRWPSAPASAAVV